MTNVCDNVGKIQEHVIHSNIITHFEKNNLLTDTQHGLRKLRSCETQLLLTINDLAKGLDDKQQIDAVRLLTFLKPLIRLPPHPPHPHQRLLLKLKHYGGSEETSMDGLETFYQQEPRKLSSTVQSHHPLQSHQVSRQVRVWALSCSLPLSTICQSVSHPRSSYLQMTACYIGRFSEFPTALNCKKSMTDSRIGRENGKCHTTPTNEKYCESPTSGIQAAQTTISTTRNLLWRLTAKYLGVTISSDLSRGKHTANITKKTNSSMAFLKRNIRSAPKTAKDIAYKIFINLGTMCRAAIFVTSDCRRTSSCTILVGIPYNGVES